MKRMTRQRETLLAVIHGHQRPITTTELHQEARKRLPGLGLATVYRALRDLVEARAVVRLQYPGKPACYEVPVPERHPHFICTVCDKVFDLPPQEAPPYPRLNPGFTPVGLEIIVYGTCPGCRTTPHSGRRTIRACIEGENRP